jgi:hypothetical protein
MGVAPAGVEKPNTGHHHLIIDTQLSPDERRLPSRPTPSTCITAAGRPRPW